MPIPVNYVLETPTKTNLINSMLYFGIAESFIMFIGNDIEFETLDIIDNKKEKVRIYFEGDLLKIDTDIQGNKNTFYVCEENGFKRLLSCLAGTYKINNIDAQMSLNPIISTIEEYTNYNINETTTLDDINNIVNEYKIEEFMEHIISDKTPYAYALKNLEEILYKKNKTGEKGLTLSSNRGIVRFVITPHPLLDPNTIVIPLDAAKRMLITMKKTDFINALENNDNLLKAVSLITLNTKYLDDTIKNKIKSRHKIVSNGNEYVKIAIDKISYENNIIKIVDFDGRYIEFEINDKSELYKIFGPSFRHILDHETVIDSRDPILAGIGYAIKKVVINRDPMASTIYMNPLQCKPYNADFDGDTMRLFADNISRFSKLHVLQIEVDENGNKKFVWKEKISEDVKLRVLYHESRYAEMSELAQQTGIILTTLRDISKDNYWDILKHIKFTVDSDINEIVDKTYNILKSKNINIAKKDVFELIYKNYYIDLDKSGKYLILKSNKHINKLYNLVNKFNPILLVGSKEENVKTTLKYFVTLYDKAYGVNHDITIKVSEIFIDIEKELGLTDYSIINILDKQNKNVDDKVDEIYNIINNNKQKRNHIKNILLSKISSQITTIDNKTLDISYTPISKKLVEEVNNIIIDFQITGKFELTNSLKRMINILLKEEKGIPIVILYDNDLFSIYNELPDKEKQNFVDDIKNVLTSVKNNINVDTPEMIIKNALKVVNNYNYKTSDIDLIINVSKFIVTNYYAGQVMKLTESIGPLVTSMVDQRVQFISVSKFFETMSKTKKLSDIINDINNFANLFDVNESNKIKNSICNKIEKINKYLHNFTNLTIMGHTDSLEFEINNKISLLLEELIKYDNKSIPKINGIDDDITKKIFDKAKHEFEINDSFEDRLLKSMKLVSDYYLADVSRLLFELFQDIVKYGEFITIDYNGRKIPLASLMEKDYGYKQLVEGLRGKASNLVHMSFQFVAMTRTGLPLNSELLGPLSTELIKYLEKIYNKENVTTNERIAVNKHIARSFGITFKNYISIDIWSDLLARLTGAEGLILRGQTVQTPGFIAKIYDVIVAQQVLDTLEQSDIWKNGKISKEKIYEILTDEYINPDNIINKIYNKFTPEEQKKYFNVQNSKIKINISNYEEFMNKLQKLILTDYEIRNDIRKLYNTKMEQIYKIVGESSERLEQQYVTKTRDIKNAYYGSVLIFYKDSSSDAIRTETLENVRLEVSFDKNIQEAKQEILDKIRRKNYTNDCEIIFAPKINRIIVIDKSLLENEKYSVNKESIYKFINNKESSDLIISNLLSLHDEYKHKKAKDRNSATYWKKFFIPTLKIFPKNNVQENIAKLAKAELLNIIAEYQVETANLVSNLLDKNKEYTLDELSKTAIKINKESKEIAKKLLNNTHYLKNNYDINIEELTYNELRLASNWFVDVSNNDVLHKGYVPLLSPSFIDGLSASSIPVSAPRQDISAKQLYNFIRNVSSMLEEFGKYIKYTAGLEKPASVGGPYYESGPLEANVAIGDLTALTIEDAVLSNPLARMFVNESKNISDFIAVKVSDFNLDKKILENGFQYDKDKIVFKTRYYLKRSKDGFEFIISHSTKNIKIHDMNEYLPVMSDDASIIYNNKVLYSGNQLPESLKGIVLPSNVGFSVMKPIMKAINSEKVAGPSGQKGVAAAITAVGITLDQEIKTYYEYERFLSKTYGKELASDLLSGRHHNFSTEIKYLDQEGRIRRKEVPVMYLFGAEIFATRLEAGTIASMLLSNIAGIINNGCEEQLIKITTNSTIGTITIDNFDKTKRKIISFNVNNGLYDALEQFGISVNPDGTFTVNDSNNLREIVNFMYKGKDVDKIYKTFKSLLKSLFEENRGSFGFTVEYGNKKLRLPIMAGKMPINILKHLSDAKHSLTSLSGRDLASKDDTSLGNRTKIQEIGEYVVSDLLIDGSNVNQIKILYSIDKNTNSIKIYWINFGDSKIPKISDSIINGNDLKIKEINMKKGQIDFLRLYFKEMLFSTKGNPYKIENNTLIDIDINNANYISINPEDYSKLDISSEIQQRSGEKVTQKTMKMFHQNSMAIASMSPDIMEMLMQRATTYYDNNESWIVFDRFKKLQDIDVNDLRKYLYHTLKISFDKDIETINNDIYFILNKTDYKNNVINYHSKYEVVNKIIDAINLYHTDITQFKKEFSKYNETRLDKFIEKYSQDLLTNYVNEKGYSTSYLSINKYILPNGKYLNSMYFTTKYLNQELYNTLKNNPAEIENLMKDYLKNKEHYFEIENKGSFSIYTLKKEFMKKFVVNTLLKMYISLLDPHKDYENLDTISEMFAEMFPLKLKINNKNEIENIIISPRKDNIGSVMMGTAGISNKSFTLPKYIMLYMMPQILPVKDDLSLLDLYFNDELYLRNESSNVGEVLSDIEKVEKAYKKIKKLVYEMVDKMSDKDIINPENIINSLDKPINNFIKKYIEDETLQPEIFDRLAVDIISKILRDKAYKSTDRRPKALKDFVNSLSKAIDKKIGTINDELKGSEDFDKIELNKIKEFYEKMNNIIKGLQILTDQLGETDIDKKAIGTLAYGLNKKIKNLYGVLNAFGVSFELPIELKSNVKIPLNNVYSTLVKATSEMISDYDAMLYKSFREGKKNLVPGWLRYQYARSKRMSDNYYKIAMKQFLDYGYSSDEFDMLKGILKNSSGAIPLMYKEEYIKTNVDYLKEAVKTYAKNNRILLESSSFADSKLQNGIINYFTHLSSLSNVAKLLNLETGDIFKMTKIPVNISATNIDEFKKMMDKISELKNLGIGFDIKVDDETLKNILKPGTTHDEILSLKYKYKGKMYNLEPIYSDNKIKYKITKNNETKYLDNIHNPNVVIGFKSPFDDSMLYASGGGLAIPNPYRIDTSKHDISRYAIKNDRIIYDLYSQRFHNTENLTLGSFINAWSGLDNFGGYKPLSYPIKIPEDKKYLINKLHTLYLNYLNEIGMLEKSKHEDLSSDKIKPLSFIDFVNKVYKNGKIYSYRRGYNDEIIPTGQLTDEKYIEIEKNIKMALDNLLNYEGDFDTYKEYYDVIEMLKNSEINDINSLVTFLKKTGINILYGRSDRYKFEGKKTNWNYIKEHVVKKRHFINDIKNKPNFKIDKSKLPSYINDKGYENLKTALEYAIATNLINYESQEYKDFISDKNNVKHLSGMNINDIISYLEVTFPNEFDKKNKFLGDIFLQAPHIRSLLSNNASSYDKLVFSNRYRKALDLMSLFKYDFDMTPNKEINTILRQNIFKFSDNELNDVIDNIQKFFNALNGTNGESNEVINEIFKKTIGFDNLYKTFNELVSNEDVSNNVKKQLVSNLLTNLFSRISSSGSLEMLFDTGFIKNKNGKIEGKHAYEYLLKLFDYANKSILNKDNLLENKRLIKQIQTGINNIKSVHITESNPLFTSYNELVKIIHDINKEFEKSEKPNIDEKLTKNFIDKYLEFIHMYNAYDNTLFEEGHQKSQYKLIESNIPKIRDLFTFLGLLDNQYVGKVLGTFAHKELIGPFGQEMFTPVGILNNSLIAAYGLGNSSYESIIQTNEGFKINGKTTSLENIQAEMKGKINTAKIDKVIDDQINEIINSVKSEFNNLKFLSSGQSVKFIRSKVLSSILNGDYGIKKTFLNMYYLDKYISMKLLNRLNEKFGNEFKDNFSIDIMSKHVAVLHDILREVFNKDELSSILEKYVNVDENEYSVVDKGIKNEIINKIKNNKDLDDNTKKELIKAIDERGVLNIIQNDIKPLLYDKLKENVLKKYKENIKTLLYSDLHSNNVNDILELVKSKKDKNIVLAGDSFERLSNVDDIRKITKEAKNVVLLPGNHDMFTVTKEGLKYIPLGVTFGDNKILSHAPYINNLKSVYKGEITDKDIELIKNNNYELLDFGQHVQNRNVMRSGHGIYANYYDKNIGGVVVLTKDENGNTELKTLSIDEYNKLLSDENNKINIISRSRKYNETTMGGSEQNIFDRFFNFLFSKKSEYKTKKTKLGHREMETFSYLSQGMNQSTIGILRSMFSYGYNEALNKSPQNLATDKTLYGFMALRDLLVDMYKKNTNLSDYEKEDLLAAYLSFYRNKLLENIGSEFTEEKIMGIMKEILPSSAINEELIKEYYSNAKKLYPLYNNKGIVQLYKPYSNTKMIKELYNMKQQSILSNMYLESSFSDSNEKRLLGIYLSAAFQDVNTWMNKSDDELKGIVENKIQLGNNAKQKAVIIEALSNYMTNAINRSAVGEFTKTLGYSKIFTENDKIKKAVEKIYGSIDNLITNIIYKRFDYLEDMLNSNTEIDDTEKEEIKKRLTDIKEISESGVGKVLSQEAAAISGNQLQLAKRAMAVSYVTYDNNTAGANYTSINSSIFNDYLTQKFGIGNEYIPINLNNSLHYISPEMLKNVEWGYAAELQMSQFERTLQLMNKIRMYDQMKNKNALRRYLPISGLPKDLENLVVAKLERSVEEASQYMVIEQLKDVLEEAGIEYGNPKKAFEIYGDVDKEYQQRILRQLLAQDLVYSEISNSLAGSDNKIENLKSLSINTEKYLEDNNIDINSIISKKMEHIKDFYKENVFKGEEDFEKFKEKNKDIIIKHGNKEINLNDIRYNELNDELKEAIIKNTNATYMLTEVMENGTLKEEHKNIIIRGIQETAQQELLNNSRFISNNVMSVQEHDYYLRKMEEYGIPSSAAMGNLFLKRSLGDYLFGKAQMSAFMLSNELIGPLMGALGFIWSLQNLQMARDSASKTGESLAPKLAEKYGLLPQYYGLTGLDFARAAGSYWASVSVGKTGEFSELLPTPNEGIFHLFNSMKGNEMRQVMLWAKTGQGTPSVINKLESMGYSKEAAENMTKSFVSAYQTKQVEMMFGLRTAAAATPLEEIKINTGIAKDILIGLYKIVDDISKVIVGSSDVSKLDEFVNKYMKAFEGRGDFYAVGKDDSSAYGRGLHQKIEELVPKYVPNNLNAGADVDKTSAYIETDKAKQILEEDTFYKYGLRFGFSMQMITALSSTIVLAFGFFKLISKTLGSIIPLASAKNKKGYVRDSLLEIIGVEDYNKMKIALSSSTTKLEKFAAVLDRATNAVMHTTAGGTLKNTSTDNSGFLGKIKKTVNKFTGTGLVLMSLGVGETIGHEQTGFDIKDNIIYPTGYKVTGKNKDYKEYYNASKRNFIRMEPDIFELLVDKRIPMSDIEKKVYSHLEYIKNNHPELYNNDEFMKNFIPRLISVVSTNELKSKNLSGSEKAIVGTGQTDTKIAIAGLLRKHGYDIDLDTLEISKINDKKINSKLETGNTENNVIDKISELESKLNKKKKEYENYDLKSQNRKYKYKKEKGSVQKEMSDLENDINQLKSSPSYINELEKKVEEKRKKVDELWFNGAPSDEIYKEAAEYTKLERELKKAKKLYSEKYYTNNYEAPKSNFLVAAEMYIPDEYKNMENEEYDFMKNINPSVKNTVEQKIKHDTNSKSSSRQVPENIQKLSELNEKLKKQHEEYNKYYELGFKREAKKIQKEIYKTEFEIRNTKIEPFKLLKNVNKKSEELNKALDEATEKVKKFGKVNGEVADEIKSNTENNRNTQEIKQTEENTNIPGINQENEKYNAGLHNYEKTAMYLGGMAGVSEAAYMLGFNNVGNTLMTGMTGANLGMLAGEYFGNPYKGALIGTGVMLGASNIMQGNYVSGVGYTLGGALAYKSPKAGLTIMAGTMLYDTLNNYFKSKDTSGLPVTPVHTQGTMTAKGVEYKLPNETNNDNGAVGWIWNNIPGGDFGRLMIAFGLPYVGQKIFEKIKPKIKAPKLDNIGKAGKNIWNKIKSRKKPTDIDEEDLSINELEEETNNLGEKVPSDKIEREVSKEKWTNKLFRALSKNRKTALVTTLAAALGLLAISRSYAEDTSKIASNPDLLNQRLKQNTSQSNNINEQTKDDEQNSSGLFSSILFAGAAGIGTQYLYDKYAPRIINKISNKEIKVPKIKGTKLLGKAIVPAMVAYDLITEGKEALEDHKYAGHLGNAAASTIANIGGFLPSVFTGVFGFAHGLYTGKGIGGAALEGLDAFSYTSDKIESEIDLQVGTKERTLETLTNKYIDLGYSESEAKKLAHDEWLQRGHAHYADEFENTNIKQNEDKHTEKIANHTEKQLDKLDEILYTLKKILQINLYTQNPNNL